MNELEYKGDWSEIKEKLKERYPALTDSDLTYEEGEEEKLFKQLQEKTGKPKKEIKDIINNL